MARLKWYLDPPTPHQLKKPVKVGPPLTTFSGSAHVKVHNGQPLTHCINLYGTFHQNRRVKPKTRGHEHGKWHNHRQIDGNVKEKTLGQIFFISCFTGIFFTDLGSGGPKKK